MSIIDNRGLDHNMTQFKTKEQAALQLALCDTHGREKNGLEYQKTIVMMQEDVATYR